MLVLRSPQNGGVFPYAGEAGADIREEEEGAVCTDAELVQRIREGDRAAEAALYTRHARAVAVTVTRLLRSHQDAQDVLQDTFIVALEEIGDLRDPGAVRGWLLQIAIRQVHRCFRRRRLLGVLGVTPSEDAMLETLAADGVSSEVRTELALIDRVLSTLAVEERIAWVLRRVEGRSLDEVAAACRCSLATAKRRIASVDERVRAHVAKGEADHG